MPFLGLGNGPYMAWPKKLKDFDRQLLNGATYQIIPSPSGIPMVKLDMAFARLDRDGNPVRSIWGQPDNLLVNIDWAKNYANPDMSVAVLMDISGSMLDVWRDGHVKNVCQTILNYIHSAGQGYDLILYSNSAQDVGYVDDKVKLGNIIANNRPSGGTYICDALRLAIKHKKKQRGLYIIVITDGEFADKQQASQLITDELMPQLTPDNPYAFRLHFVGHGEGVDHAFLRQLEQLASGQGVQMVASDHHAHLSHSHGNILDELDRAFIGRTNNFAISETKEKNSPPIITRIGELSNQEWQDGHQANFTFMPACASIGLEFLPNHPPYVPLKIALGGNNYSDRDLLVDIPLPRSTTSGISQSTSNNWTDLLKLPLFGTEESRAAAAFLKKRAEALREAEIERQTKDLGNLAGGGLPMQARERLLDLAERAKTDQAIFTSDLAPDELALLRRCGFRPRGLVTGSAMYHVGQAYASSGGDCEVKVLSEAYDQAFALAIERMKKELRLINAHGVVGVRLELVRHEWSEKSIEVTAVGTAVEGPAGYQSAPWTSDLSGQEWYALWQAGYEPADLVWGHCSWFILTNQWDEQIERGTLWSQYGNQEMDHWSTALSTARHIAMHSVQTRAYEARGCGVVGVKISRKLSEVKLRGSGENQAYEREHHNLLLSIVGTAIRVRTGAPLRSPAATYALSLRDGRLRPLSTKQAADLKITE